MHGAWRTVLSRLALAGPVLAIIEDIHWADAALLDLLEEVAEGGTGALSSCVRPARNSSRADPDGAAGDATPRRSVEPLSLADSSRLASTPSSTFDDLAPTTCGLRILERAEGNPFFLEEILRQLIDEGHLRRARQIAGTAREHRETSCGSRTRCSPC